MFDHDHSAARGLMAMRKLVIFKHRSALGNVPAHKLFELVPNPKLKDPLSPPREFFDYQEIVTPSEEQLPENVTIKVLDQICKLGIERFQDN